MLKIIAVSFFMFTSLLMASDYNLDVKKTKVMWEGKKVTGAHQGTLTMKSGKVSVEGSNLKGGEIEMDMKSIVNTDLKDQEWNKKLVGHLMSPDFFDVDKHPTVKLKIKDAILGKGGVYNITADLTIKGKTHPVMFDVDLELKDKNIKGRGAFKFDRTLYDIKYGSGKFFEGLGDKLIYDEVKVELEFEGTASN